jgi:2-keto-4-pentenoate hydratase/2-oxohepta-3-ene-1,7-dioic acid hydratase in catechol pathway
MHSPTTVFCIGRNYAAHAAEMGAVVPDDPIVFLKPPAAVCDSGSTILLPTWSNDVHHEVELVVMIGQDTNGIAVEDAWSVVSGIGVGIDLTARDVQAKAKQRGEPWATAKGWLHSAPLSAIVPLDISGKGPWDITLTVNGELRQHGNTSRMERSIPQLVSYIASVFSLRAGDLIFTGTPEGVAAVHRGDTAEASLGDLAHLSVSFA